MLKKLKKAVCEANLRLLKEGLITLTWGNASAIDRDRDLVVINPSGVEYDGMAPEDMVVLDLHSGDVVEGRWKPSIDAPTHLELYRNFESIGGVVQSHSRWATVFAQAHRPIPPFGTTHADYFYGAIPCTRLLAPEEISGDYELATGRVIVETFRGTRPEEIPAVLVASQGPFIWGKTIKEAVHNAVVLEELAFTAWHTQQTDPGLPVMQQALLEKRYQRRNGTDSYYGQKWK